MVAEHYVYAYLREDGSPYYIGKGVGNRYKKRHSIAIPPEERIQFVANNLTNEEACAFEKLLILKLGRKDLGTGILRNQTEGGDGGDTSDSSGYKTYYKSEKFLKDAAESSERMKKQNPLFCPKERERRKKTQGPAMKAYNESVVKMSDKEFEEWLSKKKLYDKNGKRNGYVVGIMKKRGCFDEYYPLR